MARRRVRRSRPLGGRTRAKTRGSALPPLPWIGAGVAIIAAVLFLVAFLNRSEAGPPRIGDHWHVAYQISLCGELQPDLPQSPGGVHTHGDGLIHMHPETPADTGSNANLRRFFATTGTRFTHTSIQLPNSREYKNGDACPSGQPGTLRLLVNGVPNDQFENYAPQQGDLVRIEFR